MNPSRDVRAAQFNPAVLLKDLRVAQGCRYVDIVSGSTSWQVYVERGKLSYVSHSVEYVLARIQHHLHVLGLSGAIAACKDEALIRARLSLDTLACGIEMSDRILTFLFSQRLLEAKQTKEIAELVTREALESLLCITSGTYTLKEQTLDIDTGCSLDIIDTIAAAEKRLAKWRSFAPVLWSPYQRPRISETNTTDASAANYQLSPQMRRQLEPILKGYTLRQLAIVLKQDEQKIAQFLYPHILNNSIALDDPPAPYDRLPAIEIDSEDTPPEKSSTVAEASSKATSARPVGSSISPKIASPSNGRSAIASASVKQLKIACVDDSPTILTQIDRFLNDSGDRYAITPITDSVKALVQIIRLKPDLILMDVGMPNINGYDLCRLLRNNRLFKTTPIVMVTGNTATVDRMKAKIVGATDFLAKPFTQGELVAMVSRHLS